MITNNLLHPNTVHDHKCDTDSVHKDNGRLDSVVDHWTFLPGLMIHNGNAPRETPTLAPGKYRSPLTSGKLGRYYNISDVSYM